MNVPKQLPVDDWTDQDLLTKDEARARLVDEIDHVQDALTALNATVQPDPAAVGLLERRLNAMRSIRGDYDTHLDGKSR